MTDLDLRNPFGGKDLMRGETPCRNGVEDGVDHITALTLHEVLVNVLFI